MKQINDIVQVSEFDKGKAEDIFTSVKNHGPKIVAQNDEPLCVLISYDDFDHLVDALEDLQLAMKALTRLNKSLTTISQSEVDARLGFDSIDLEDLDDVIIE